MKTVYNVRVGEPDVEMSAPSHIKGVQEGNAPDGAKITSGAGRSTGINAASRETIDPKMPKLSPA